MCVIITREWFMRKSRKFTPNYIGSATGHIQSLLASTGALLKPYFDSRMNRRVPEKLAHAVAICGLFGIDDDESPTVRFNSLRTSGTSCL